MYNMIRHKNIREAIINLILVKEGGRNAYLYRRSFKYTKEKNDFVINLSENLFLRYFLQDQGIVFVNDTSRIPTPHRELNDIELGDLLGYSCNTHDYSNPDLELIDVTISFGDVHIYSEGCEKFKIEKEKLINDVTQK